MAMNQSGVPAIPGIYNPGAEYAGMQAAQQTTDQPGNNYTPPEQYMQTQAAPGPTAAEQKAYVLSQLAQNGGDKTKLQPWAQRVIGDLSPEQIQKAISAGDMMESGKVIQPVTGQVQAPPVYSPANEMAGLQSAQGPKLSPVLSWLNKAFAPGTTGGIISAGMGAGPQAGIPTALGEAMQLAKADPAATARALQASAVPAPAESPKPDQQIPITPTPQVAAQAPVAKAENAAQTAAQASTAADALPKTAADTKVADTVAKFTDYLKNESSGSKLANILGNVLDAIGVGFSGAAGQQRQTRLQQAYQVQLQSQLAANQARTAVEQQVAQMPVQVQQAYQTAKLTGNVQVWVNTMTEAGVTPYKIQQILAAYYAGLGPGASVSNNPDQYGIGLVNKLVGGGQ